MLKNKNVLLCVTGSIAAYKTANLASMLVKAGATVLVAGNYIFSAEDMKKRAEEIKSL